MTKGKKLLNKLHRQDRAAWNTGRELADYCQEFCGEELSLNYVDGEGFGLILTDNIDAMIPFHAAIKLIETKGRIDRRDIELVEPLDEPYQ